MLRSCSPKSCNFIFLWYSVFLFFVVFATSSTEIYTLSLHDALPIYSVDRFVIVSIFIPKLRLILILNSFLGSSDSLDEKDRKSGSAGMPRPTSYAVFCLKKKK